VRPHRIMKVEYVQYLWGGGGVPMRMGGQNREEGSLCLHLGPIGSVTRFLISKFIITKFIRYVTKFIHNKIYT
jgi:hypothetical protein